MIDKVSGKVAYAVISFGGFLGRRGGVHVPWAKLATKPQLEGIASTSRKANSKRRLMFYRDRDFDWNDRESERELHEYWRSPIYWSGF